MRIGLFFFFLILGAGPIANADDVPSGNFLNYKYPSNIQNSRLDGAELGKCLAAATVKGGKHSIDRSSKGQLKSLAILLGYLDGEPSATTISTGLEEKLEEWVLKQPDNSVNPMAIYEKSLEYNNGNVWSALHTVHQLLRREARYYHWERYHHNSTQEHAESLFNKLIDIRGDLKERGASFTGDHFGGWYRIWGFMMGAHINIGDQTIEVPCSGSHKLSVAISNFAKSTMHSVVMSVLGTAASLENEVAKWSYEQDTGKHAVNITGLHVGISLVNNLWFDPMSPKEADGIYKECEKLSYLGNRKPAFGKRKPR